MLELCCSQSGGLRLRPIRPTGYGLILPGFKVHQR